MKRYPTYDKVVKYLPVRQFLRDTFLYKSDITLVSHGANFVEIFVTTVLQDKS